MGPLKELLAQISAYARLQVAIVAKLEELEKRIYSLEEHRKLKDATIQNLSNDLHALKMTASLGVDSFV